MWPIGVAVCSDMPKQRPQHEPPHPKSVTDPCMRKKRLSRFCAEKLSDWRVADSVVKKSTTAFNHYSLPTPSSNLMHTVQRERSIHSSTNTTAAAVAAHNIHGSWNGKWNGAR